MKSHGTKMVIKPILEASRLGQMRNAYHWIDVNACWN